MNGLKKANITLDRKQLSEIAVHDDAVFATLVKKSMAALSK
jgi:large subunit ribosomal protein L20